jgi:hypothetical protein
MVCRQYRQGVAIAVHTWARVALPRLFLFAIRADCLDADHMLLLRFAAATKLKLCSRLRGRVTEPK